MIQLYRMLMQQFPHIHQCKIDSRLVEKGDLFFALKGEKVDGHSFLKEVQERGAIGAVVDQKIETSCDFPVFKVADVKDALQQMGSERLAILSAKVVGITGSLGKTTTKEFMRQLEGGHLKAVFSPRSYNSQLTLPLNLLNFPQESVWWGLEMGMSQPGNIEQLISLAPPKVALVTTISWQHVTHFSNGLEGIAFEKSRIFSHPQTEIGLYNADTPYANLLRSAGTCEKRSFSLRDSAADYFLKVVSNEQVKVFHQGKEYCFPWKIGLPHHLQNFLAAVSTLHEMGLSFSIMQERAENLHLVGMRFERVEKKGVHFINDAYNANPEAMIAAMSALPHPKCGGRKVGVLSQMDDLGSYTHEGHYLVGQHALKHLDLLICLGVNCRTIEMQWKEQGLPCIWVDSFDALKESVKAHIKPEDVVLIKGARKYALERLLEEF